MLAFELMVVMVRVVLAGADEVTLRVVGVKMQVLFAGRPLQANVRLPLKPFTGTAARVKLADSPPVMVADGAEELKAKVGEAPETVVLFMAPKRPWASLARPAVK